MCLVEGAFFGRKLFDALCGVEVSVVEEVARDGEVCFVGYGAFSADVEPAVSCEESIEPDFEDFGRDEVFSSVEEEGEIADL